jgi:hypothetical protein
MHKQPLTLSCRRVCYLLLLLALVSISDAIAQAPPFDHSLPIPALVFDEKGELVHKASATSSPLDFDFFVGKRRIFNTRLKSRFTGSNEWEKSTAIVEMQKVFKNSLANIDVGSFEGPSPFEGMTVRVFNPQTKLWSLYWVNSITGVLSPPLVGSFEKGVGHFFAKMIREGRDIIAVFRWDARDKENPKWSQAFSPDNGKTWEWNWYMTYEKIN